MIKEVKQFCKFLIVGGINTILNLAILYLLTEFFGLYYVYSAILGFFLAVINSYFFNKYWTFKDNTSVFGKQFYFFFIISVFALLSNITLLYIFTEFFKINYMISEIIAIFLSLWINFFGNKKLTFKK